MSEFLMEKKYIYYYALRDKFKLIEILKWYNSINSILLTYNLAIFRHFCSEWPQLERSEELII